MLLIILRSTEISTWPRDCMHDAQFVHTCTTDKCLSREAAQQSGPPPRRRVHIRQNMKT